jgi:hypothetical protein
MKLATTTAVLAIAIGIILGSSQAQAQQPRRFRSNPLSENNTTSKIWFSTGFSAGLAAAIPVGEPNDVGPAGLAWGIDGTLNVGHAVAFTIRYQSTKLSRNQSVIDYVKTNEFIAIADIPLINTSVVRWALLAGAGLVMLEVKQDRYRFADNGMPAD